MTQLSKGQDSQTRNLVFLAGVVTTLLVWTSLTDPISLPKMLMLSLFSSWIFGTVAVSLAFGGPKKISLGQWAILIFMAGIILAALLTDVRYTAFFGTPQRNNGAISYLAFAVLGLAAMMSFEPAQAHRLRTTLLVVGAILTGYGLFQATGHDPFKWTLLYGPVVGTLGNPDFMSAILGVTSIATLWLVLGKGKIWLRASGVVLLVIEIYVVRQSRSVQGLLALVFGLVVLILAQLWQINRRVGLVVWLVAGIGAVPVLLGLVGKGPLSGYLYRSSLKNRLDYWHAALGMFKTHPLLGVGLDRFAENYGKYAPQIQVSHGQATNNAHDVFLQLLATGGLIVILPYLFLLGVIFYEAVKAIKSSTGQAQFDLIALFAIWFALFLISIISIDNLGVAVWFWISGGALYALAHEGGKAEGDKKAGKKRSGRTGKTSAPNNATYVSPIVSLVLTVLVLILMVPAWRTAAMVADLQVNKSQLSPAQFLKKVNEVANIQPKNSQTFYSLSDIAMRIHNPELALKFVKVVIQKDPKSNYGHQLAAIAYESEKKYQSAIPYRVVLLELDPWNTANMVILIKDYLQVKDMTNAAAISAKIARLYPGSADAKTAAALVKG